MANPTYATKAERKEQERLELEQKFATLPDNIKLALEAVEKLIADPEKLKKLEAEMAGLEEEIKGLESQAEELEAKKEELESRKTKVEETIEKTKGISGSIQEFKETISRAL